MEIVLTNALEMGMPEEMANHCRTLIQRRVMEKFDGKVKPGDDVTILYSEKDPLGESEEVDDTAYMIYFTVEAVTGEQVNVLLEG